MEKFDRNPWLIFSWEVRGTASEIKSLLKQVAGPQDDAIEHGGNENVIASECWLASLSPLRGFGTERSRPRSDTSVAEIHPQFVRWLMRSHRPPEPSRWKFHPFILAAQT